MHFMSAYDSGEAQELSTLIADARRVVQQIHYVTLMPDSIDKPMQPSRLVHDQLNVQTEDMEWNWIPHRYSAAEAFADF